MREISMRKNYLLVVAVALALVLTPMLAVFDTLADHDPFGGEPQTSVTICHSGNGKNFVSNSPNITATGGNINLQGHEGHEYDVIPPFHFDDNGTILSYPGKNWTPENEALWNSGGCDGEYEEEEEPVLGCMDPEATNYDENATEDDESCEYEEEEEPVLGCMDPEATNYDENATEDDESCEYEEEQPAPKKKSSSSTPQPEVLGDEAAPEFTLTIVVEPSVTNPGSTVSVTVTAQNTGEATGENVVVTVDLPLGFDEVANSGIFPAFFGNIANAAGPIVWEFGTLDIDEIWTTTFDVEVGANVDLTSYDFPATLTADNYSETVYAQDDLLVVAGEVLGDDTLTEAGGLIDHPLLAMLMFASLGAFLYIAGVHAYDKRKLVFLKK